MVRLLGLVFLAVLCGQASAQEAVQIEGRWNTGQGPITISRDASGDGYSIVFEQFPGKVTAMLSGDRMTGQWWDIANVQPCEAESDGSKHWGGFQVSFYGPPNIDRRVFQGIWTYCELVPAIPPEGVSRISGSNFSGEMVE